MATISAQISDELMEKANKRSEELYNKQNRSAYISHLIQRDLEGNAFEVNKTDENCLLVLADKFIDPESEDMACAALESHKIKQSHFLGHIIREAARALHLLKKNQDWHEIKCILSSVEKDNTPPTDTQMESEKSQIYADMERNKQLNKEAG